LTEDEDEDGSLGTAPDAAIPLSDVAHIRAILVDTARRREPLSYAELLNALGHPFSRPRMRALCRTLDAVDAAAEAQGEPELAVLVVRRSDGLPGQGWWVGVQVSQQGYTGPWTGPDARAFVRGRQERAFAFWTSRLGEQPHTEEAGSNSARPEGPVGPERPKSGPTWAARRSSRSVRPTRCG
jgi:hypothetical protein